MLQSDTVLRSRALRPVSFGVLSIRLVLLLSACIIPLFADAASADGGQIKAELLANKEILQPPRSEDQAIAKLGIHLTIASGWHTYWRNSGEAAIPTKVMWQLPDGWNAGDLEWPLPKKFLERGGITTYGYNDEVLLTAPLYGPTVIPGTDQPLTFRAKVTWLVCKDICVPGSANIEKQLVFSASKPEQPSKEFDVFQRFGSLLPEPWPGGQGPSNVVVHTEGEKSDDGTTVLLKVAGLAGETPDKYHALFQVFPSDTLPGKLPEPELAVVQAGSSTTPSKEALIRLRYPSKALAALKPGMPIRGVLAVSQKLTGLKQDSGYSWELDPEKLPAAGAADSRDQKFSPLTYRIESHVEAPIEAPMVRRSEDTSLLFAILFAFIGGLILNLMPCVLPIISIKIMGFVDAGQKGRGRAFVSSLWFSAGILSSVLSLALTIVTLRGFGYSLGWGFQFQHPAFVFALAAIVFVLSLSFFDLYTIELPGLNKANKLASALTSDQAKSFFDGVLATALSTPCTAPFLGTALVFAFSQPPYATILVFLAIGVGLSLPYMILATTPKLTGLLPKPGVWMFRFRQFLGFLLLATVLWLIFVLHSLTNLGALWAASFLLVLFFCLWLIRGFGDQRVQAGKGRLLIAAVVLVYSFAKIYPRVVVVEVAKVKSIAEAGWKDFSDDLVRETLAGGHPVFIDFTASWCLTCKANELATIDTEETYAKLRDLQITPLRADWTAGDPVITEALKRYGAEGVPLYVILPPGGRGPIVLSGIISKTSLYKAFEQAAGK